MPPFSKQQYHELMNIASQTIVVHSTLTYILLLYSEWSDVQCQIGTLNNMKNLSKTGRNRLSIWPTDLKSGRRMANRLEVREAKRILDLGCGTGNSTKILKDKFPDAMVIGADNSDEMLAKAKKTHPDIEFIHLDVGGDLGEVKGKFDIVFSNACLQWIPNHEILLPKLMSLLRQGGVLAVQIPIQSEHPVHIIMNELVTTAKWKDKLSQRNYHNLSTCEYYDVLSGISDDFEVWETIYCHRMPSYESIIEWYKGTGLRPYLEQLCETDAEEFVSDVYRELKNRYKIQSNREIMFRFPRLFFIAKRD